MRPFVLLLFSLAAVAMLFVSPAMAGCPCDGEKCVTKTIETTTSVTVLAVPERPIIATAGRSVGTVASLTVKAATLPAKGLKAIATRLRERERTPLLHAAQGVRLVCHRVACRR